MCARHVSHERNGQVSRLVSSERKGEKTVFSICCVCVWPETHRQTVRLGGRSLTVCMSPTPVKGLRGLEVWWLLPESKSAEPCNVACIPDLLFCGKTYNQVYNLKLLVLQLRVLQLLVLQLLALQLLALQTLSYAVRCTTKLVTLLASRLLVLQLLLLYLLVLQSLSFAVNHLLGVLVKASTSRAEDLGFKFPLALWGFFWVESYQWLQNWHSIGYPARRLVL